MLNPLCSATTCAHNQPRRLDRAFTPFSQLRGARNTPEQAVRAHTNVHSTNKGPAGVWSWPEGSGDENFHPAVVLRAPSLSSIFTDPSRKMQHDLHPKHAARTLALCCTTTAVAARW